MTLQPQQLRRPRTVEVVGPAGAGKTTLLRALGAAERRVDIIADVATLRAMPTLARNAVAMAPTLARQYRERHGLTWREVRLIVRLNALQRILARRTASSQAVTLVDQGPVYTIARLHEFGFERTTNRHLKRWWQSIFETWSAALDAIIWLDAPDAILIGRILDREKWHAVKGQSENDAYRFLARFRSCYERTIAQLSSGSGPRVVRFDTGQQSLQQIVEQVLAILD